MMIYAYLAGLLMLITSAIGLEWHGHSRGVADTEARYAAQAAEAAAENTRIERNRIRNSDEVTNGYIAAKNHAQANDAAARSELDRLRNALAKRGRAASDAAPGCGANAERVRVLEGLLGESASLAEEGGRRVGELDARLEALQGYTRRVCLAPATP